MEKQWPGAKTETGTKTPARRKANEKLVARLRIRGPMPNSERIVESSPAGPLPNGSSYPDGSNSHPRQPAGSESSKESGSEKWTGYEFIDSRELARRLTVPTSWIRDQVRARSEDPLPHVNLGKYVRFLWGSPALELWISRRIVVGNNRRLGRTRRKEQE